MRAPERGQESPHSTVTGLYRGERDTFVQPGFDRRTPRIHGMYGSGSPNPAYGDRSNTRRDVWRPAEQPAGRRPSDRETAGAYSRDEEPPSGSGAKLAIGIALAVLVLALGVIAKTHGIATLQLRVDRHIALDDRDGALTAFAKVMTTIGQPAIGAGLMIVVPAVLFLLKRRLVALRVFCVIAGALALTTVVKSLIHEHRPPQALWAYPPDGTWSFPSGHATTSTALAIALVIIVGASARRRLAIAVGVVFALLVCWSRVYLGDHYPLDVTAGVLAALSAGFVVAGLAALPAVRPLLRRLDASGGASGSGGRRRAG